jgi:hypothetical protein
MAGLHVHRETECTGLKPLIQIVLCVLRNFGRRAVNCADRPRQRRNQHDDVAVLYLYVLVPPVEMKFTSKRKWYEAVLDLTRFGDK